MSYLNLELDVDSPHRHTHGSLESSPKADLFPPFINAVDNRHQTKLEKLLKTTDLEGPNTNYFKHLDPEMAHRNEKLQNRAHVSSLKSLHVNQKEILNGDNLIADPLYSRGLVNLLKSMQKQIQDLAFLRSQSKGITSLALIKTRLKMRRKSDASQWSGGISHLEQMSPFLTCEYKPAIALFDSTVKKESPSPFLKSVVDTMMSLRQKTLENTITPDKRGFRDQDHGINNSTLTIIAPEMSFKTCHGKNTTVLTLEDDLSPKKGPNKYLAEIRDFIQSMGFGNNLGLKPRIIIVGIEHLKDIPEALTNIQSPIAQLSQRAISSRTDLSKKASEPVKSTIELKLPIKNRRKNKVNTVVVQSKSKHPMIDTGDSITPELSQELVMSDTETRFDEKRESSRFSKNVRIQTVSKKKLATILSPPKSKKLDGTKSPEPNPRRNYTLTKETYMTEEIQENHDLHKFSHFRKIKAVQSHRASPVGSKLEINNSSIIQQAYHNKNNIKQMLSTAKATKAKNFVVEELKPLRQRNLILSKTYAGLLLSPKYPPKKLTVV